MVLMLLSSTAGIGEKILHMRKLVCNDMDYFGIHWMKLKNEVIKKTVRENYHAKFSFHHSKNLSDTNWMKKM
jgi:acetate kinase